MCNWEFPIVIEQSEQPEQASISRRWELKHAHGVEFGEDNLTTTHMMVFIRPVWYDDIITCFLWKIIIQWSRALCLRHYLYRLYSYGINIVRKCARACHCKSNNRGWEGTKDGSLLSRKVVPTRVHSRMPKNTECPNQFSSTYDTVDNKPLPLSYLFLRFRRLALG